MRSGPTLRRSNEAAIAMFPAHNRPRRVRKDRPRPAWLRPVRRRAAPDQRPGRRPWRVKALMRSSHWSTRTRSSPTSARSRGRHNLCRSPAARSSNHSPVVSLAGDVGPGRVVAASAHQVPHEMPRHSSFLIFRPAKPGQRPWGGLGTSSETLSARLPNERI